MVETRNSLVGPVFTQCGKDMTQGVRPTPQQNHNKTLATSHGWSLTEIMLGILYYTYQGQAWHLLVEPETSLCSWCYLLMELSPLAVSGPQGLLFLPGNGSIYVRDDYLVIPAPQIDCAMASTGALVLCRHTKHHIIWTLLQLQAGLQKTNSHSHAFHFRLLKIKQLINFGKVVGPSKAFFFQVGRRE